MLYYIFANLSTKKIKFLVLLAGIGGVIIIGIMVSWFADLSYYEMGFVKSKTTGSVDTSKVYTSGRHWIGIQYTFKKFPADYQTLKFKQIEVFNKEKLEITMTCHIQYRLRPEDLAELHDTFDVRYEPIIRSTMLAAIKSTAPKFTVNEYRLNRTQVEEGLKTAVVNVIEGTCCRRNCETSNSCRLGCVPYSQCNSTQRGLFSEVGYFHLKNIDLTPEQKERFLKRVLDQERVDTELFKQEEKLARKTTEQKRILIENEAKEIKNQADADSSLIIDIANAKAEALREGERRQGLKIIYDALNITDPKHKNSIDYLRTLIHSKNELFVGFQYMVARP